MPALLVDDYQLMIHYHECTGRNGCVEEVKTA